MTTQLTFIGDDTASVSGAGTLTLHTPGGMIDPAVLVACIFQATSASITPPSGWTEEAAVSANLITVWVHTWNLGDPTSYDWTVGDAAVGMLVAIGNADLSIVNGSSTPGGGSDATKIETPSQAYSVSDPYRPFAYVGFGCATSQVGSFTDFQYGDSLIGQVTNGGKTLVGGYQLGLAADGGSSPTYHFTGANAATRHGIGVIVRFSGIPGTPDCPGTAGWAVSVT